MNYCLILAAGLGSRMKSKRPKCLHTILGKEMINYIIDSTKINIIDKTICILSNDVKNDAVKAIGDIEYCIQKKALGTANAVASAIDDLDYDGITVVIPSDTPLINKELISNLINSHIENNNNLTIATMIQNNPYGYGRIIRDKNDNIIRIKEESEITESEMSITECNGGIYCIDNNILIDNIFKIKNNNTKGEYYFTDIVNIVHKKYKKIGSFECDCNLIRGVNTLIELQAVTKYLKDSINNYHLSNGVILEDFDCEIGPDVLIEPGAIIKKGSIILGESKIASNVIVGPYSEIVNSEIQSNSIINKSSIYNSKIGKNCQIGPYSHIRCNTLINDNCRIGNYVEIKNSMLKCNVKSSHLAYIGDAHIGENVNFGCGSITVNYDGLSKNKTIIGDNSFIGCNSNIIAPIKLGDNTYIAAGSTITKDLNDGDFAIARAHQIIKSNYNIKKSRGK